MGTYKGPLPVESGGAGESHGLRVVSTVAPEETVLNYSNESNNSEIIPLPSQAPSYRLLCPSILPLIHSILSSILWES